MSGRTPPPGKLAGEEGENFVEEVCSRLGRDFLFRGQKYKVKGKESELCDLLLLLDDTAVLMEVKTANRTEVPNRTEEQWAEYANDRLKKALRQIERGVKAIRAGEVKRLENKRQGKVRLELERIKHFYGIAIINHPSMVKVGRGPVVDVGGTPVGVLTTTHEELIEVLIELSTPGDLLDYLRARERFFEKNMMIGVSELDRSVAGG